MASRLSKAFQDASSPLLSVFSTAGFPEKEDTLVIAERLEQAGVEMLEIGFPFSDPVADGPTIQAASQKALAQGMSLQVLFSQLKELRPRVQIPALLMGYVNPVWQYGVERFVASCSECGIDGVILPDLPPEVFVEDYAEMFSSAGLAVVLLVTPQTSLERMRFIDEVSTGFVYAVSSFGVTGSQLELSSQQQDYFSRLQAAELSNPLMVGFGIQDKASFEVCTKYADGAIVGSGFLRWIEEHGTSVEALTEFVEHIRGTG